jgi:hypothetical protein
MNKINYLIGICFLLLCIVLQGAQAQNFQQASSKQTRHYEMKLIYIADAPGEKYLRAFVRKGDTIGPSSGYTSLHAPELRKWLKDYFARGSTIEWTQSCDDSGGPSGKEIDDFQAFCEAEGIKFIIHPAG